MTGTVGHIGDKLIGMSFRISEQAVHGPDHHFYDINIFPFIEASDVVSLSYIPFVEYQIDGTCVVHNV